MGKLTIKDIAKMADVSISVVSMVLNEKPGVNADTRNRVLEIIKRTGYKPALTSRRMIYQKSFNISVLIKQDYSPFQNLFYFELAQGAMDRCKEYGYNLVFTRTSGENGSGALPDIIENSDTDGVIFLQEYERRVLQEVEQRGIPFVLVDSHQHSPDYLSVSVDYARASYVAATYLISNRHTDIGMICSQAIPGFAAQISGGFNNALAEYGLTLNPAWVQTDATDETSAFNCMDRILHCGKRPTAILCAADDFAIGAMRCAEQHGIKIPQELSFIGIDDILLARYVKPALTTVNIDKYRMGELAIDLLMQKMEKKSPENVIVESGRLVVRDSVREIDPV